MCKRIITLIMSIALLASFLGLQTVITASDLYVEFSSETIFADQGDNVTMKVFMDENPGIATMKFKIIYNSEYMSNTAINSAAILSDSGTVTVNTSVPGVSIITWVQSDGDNIVGTGEIFSLDFAVKTDAVAGSKCEVSFVCDNDDFNNTDFDSLDVNIKSGYIYVTSPESQQIIIDSVEGDRGENVDVAVNLKNDLGIATFKTKVMFDSSKFTVTDVKVGSAVSEGAFNYSIKDGYVLLTWYNEDGEDTVLNGQFAVISLKVADDASYVDYDVKALFDAADINTEDFIEVPFTSVDGKFTVRRTVIPEITFKASDANALTNGDAEVLFSLSDNVDIASFRMKIKFDSSLTVAEVKDLFTAAEGGEFNYSVKDGYVIVTWYKDTGISFNGDLFSIKFKTTSEGDKAITFEVMDPSDFSDTDFNDIIAHFIDGKITVTAPVVTVESITVKAEPTKKDYKVGESFDVTNGVITVKYSDGSTKDINIENSMITFDNSKADPKAVVTVTYEGKTATLNVNVHAADEVTNVKMLVATAAKLSYKVNDELDVTGLSLEVYYYDGTSKVIPVTKDMVTKFDTSKVGKFDMEIKYLTYTFNQLITIEKTPAKTGDSGIVYLYVVAFIAMSVVLFLKRKSYVK